MPLLLVHSVHRAILASIFFFQGCLKIKLLTLFRKVCKALQPRPLLTFLNCCCRSQTILRIRSDLSAVWQSSHKLHLCLSHVTALLLGLHFSWLPFALQALAWILKSFPHTTRPGVGRLHGLWAVFYLCKRLEKKYTAETICGAHSTKLLSFVGDAAPQVTVT